MKTKKLLPENIQIPTPAHRASATGLMGFSDPLPECPSRLPDGTILDYSAVDETWKDVDFPEREIKTESVQESRNALEESFFRDFREFNQSHSNPAHLVKHMTRVQGLAAMTPSKDETVKVVKFPKVESAPVLQKWQSKEQQAIQAEELFAESVNSVNAVLESNDLVIEAESLESFVAGLEEVLESHELTDADRAAIQQFVASVVERSDQSKANKSARRSAELGQKLAYNKAQASTSAKKDPLNPTGKPRLSATLKPAAKPFVKWASKPSAAQ